MHAETAMNTGAVEAHEDAEFGGGLGRSEGVIGGSVLLMMSMAIQEDGACWDRRGARCRVY